MADAWTIPEGYLQNTLAGIVSSGPQYLAFHIALFTGDVIYWEFTNGLNYDQSSYCECLNPMDHRIFIRRTGGLVEAYNVKTKAGGEIISASKLSPGTDSRMTGRITFRGLIERRLTN